jgi:hypothetical protein
MITVLLWEISVCLTRFKARDRERREHPLDQCVLAIRAVSVITECIGFSPS